MTVQPLAAADLRVGRFLVPVLITLELFSGLIQGWIVPLLGSVAEHYRVSGGAVSWVLTVGLLSSAVSVPLMVVLADRFGRQKLLVIAVVLSAVGSVLIALAPAFPLVLLGAVIQGPVAACLPLEMALLKHFRPERANRIIGYLVGMLTIGVALGAVLGGVAMDAIGNLPVVQFLPAAVLVLFIPIVWRLVPRDSGDATRSVDWLGATTLGIALVGVMYGLSEGPVSGWGSLTVLLPLVIGGIALVGFFIAESRVSTPLVDVKALKGARLLPALVVGFLASMALFGNQTPTVLYFTADPGAVGYGLAGSAGLVGIVFGVTALFSSAGAFLSYRVAKGIGSRFAVAVGCLCIAVGVGGMVFAPRELLVVVGLGALSAFGSGIAFGILPGLVVERAPETSAASVSGVYNTTRTLGGALAGAFVASILAAVLLSGGGADASAPPVPALGAFQLIWGVFAGLNVVAAAVALALGRSRADEASASSTDQNSPDDALTIGATS
ncbi:Major Facilitator Superfamily protein [Agromyces sp. CF514]|uniref:MFS transporter n=1 Tax=Agromyces sp. CF514 TaxID=1881031 RepID=UPI0008E517D1|nr:MFS transporter [Agromyces sp. CF514]SFR90334.1 Major Facilitator Superfamily protein [Agromyces sp. CF514]